MLLMLMQVCLMVGLGSFRVSCKSVMDGICVATRTLEVITMKGQWINHLHGYYL
jgi:hypothetical protein